MRAEIELRLALALAFVMIALLALGIRKLARELDRIPVERA